MGIYKGPCVWGRIFHPCCFYGLFFGYFCCGIKFLALPAIDWTVGVESFLCLMLKFDEWVKPGFFRCWSDVLLWWLHCPVWCLWCAYCQDHLQRGQWQQQIIPGYQGESFQMQPLVSNSLFVGNWPILPGGLLLGYLCHPLIWSAEFTPAFDACFYFFPLPIITWLCAGACETAELAMLLSMRWLQTSGKVPCLGCHQCLPEQLSWDRIRTGMLMASPLPKAGVWK